MIEPLLKFDNFSKSDNFAKSDSFTKSTKSGAGLRRELSDLLSGIPEPGLSSHERHLLESSVILRPLNTAPISRDEMLHPRLTILADNLTDPEELARLKSCAETIQETRGSSPAYSRKGFAPSLYVLGAGAEYSEAFPYRVPEAQKLRDDLSTLGAIFFERPADASADKLRRHMERLLDGR